MALCQKQGYIRSMIASKSTSKEQSCLRFMRRPLAFSTPPRIPYIASERANGLLDGLSTVTRSTSQSELSSGLLGQSKVSTERDRRIRWYCLRVCSSSARKDLWDMEWRTCAYYRYMDREVDTWTPLNWGMVIHRYPLIAPLYSHRAPGIADLGDAPGA